MNDNYGKLTVQFYSKSKQVFSGANYTFLIKVCHLTDLQVGDILQKLAATNYEGKVTVYNSDVKITSIDPNFVYGDSTQYKLITSYEIKSRTGDSMTFDTATTELCNGISDNQTCAVSNKTPCITSTLSDCTGNITWATTDHTIPESPYKSTSISTIDFMPDYGSWTISGTGEKINELISTAINNYDKEKKEEKKMDFNKMFNVEFGKIDAPKFFRMSPYGLAVSNGDGKFYAYNKAEGNVVDVTSMTFEDTLAYKMPVAITDIKRGDMIFQNQKVFYVIGANESDFSVVDPVTSEMKVVLPIKNMFGFNYITKVFSMLDGFNPSENNPFGINPMMFALMDNTKEDKTMMMMALMPYFTQNTKSNNPMQAMLPFMLLNGKDTDMTTMMAMMMMGQNFSNPTTANSNKPAFVDEYNG